jgi:hypothetical protein
MSNGQLKGFAVESLIRESGADFSSKELKDVSRKNRNLALKATSAEISGSGRKDEVGCLQDNPRRLGKGWARLVGSTPLKPDRKVRGRRQDSRVPAAAFARCRHAKKEPRGEDR